MSFDSKYANQNFYLSKSDNFYNNDENKTNIKENRNFEQIFDNEKKLKFLEKDLKLAILRTELLNEKIQISK